MTSTQIAGWTREQMAQRAALDIADGSYVNLGIGMPELVAKYVPEGREVLNRFAHPGQQQLARPGIQWLGCEQLQAWRDGDREALDQEMLAAMESEHARTIAENEAHRTHLESQVERLADELQTREHDVELARRDA